MTKQKDNNYHVIIEEAIESLNSIRGKIPSANLIGIIKKLKYSAQIFLAMDEKSVESDLVDYEAVPEDWGGKFLQSIIEGIKDKKVLEIYYQPFYEDKPYFIRVHPYLLKEFRSRWYLIGLNDTKKELRTYGLDRIWEINETDVPYIKKSFKTKEYFKNSIGIISPSGEPPKIRIEVKKPQAQYLITQPIHPSQNIEYEDDNTIVFNYKVHTTYEFKALLLGLGSDLIVLEPASLRNELINELREALNAYELP